MIFVEPLFSFPDNAIASTTEYTEALIASLTPFIFLYLGLILGIVIIGGIFDIIRRRRE